MADLIVEFTKKEPLFGRQKYRFRIKSGGNGKTLAVSNDAYTNEEDMENAVDVLFAESRAEIQYKYLY